MRSILLFLFVFFLSFATFSDVQARSRQRVAVDKYADIVIEANTGYILRSRSSNAQRYPASLTKMMTLYLVFQALEHKQITLETEFRVSQLAAQQPATKIGLKAGDKISVYDCIMSMITLSANDAAVVAAEGVGGSLRRFVQMMNQQARFLGMKNSQFKNPSGLPHQQQVTTAYDMAILAQAIVFHYPAYYPYFAQTKHHYDNRTFRGHNHLMARYNGMDGIKTGYTNASGFNLASSSIQDGVRLIGVVLGGQSAKRRDDQMADILDTAFKRVEWPSVKKILARGIPRYNSADYLTLAEKELLPQKIQPQQTQLALNKKQLLQLPLTTTAAMGKLSPVVTQPPPVASSPLPTAAPSSSVKIPTTALSEQWGLQIGAFSEQSGAERILTETAQRSGDLLKGARQSLQKLTMTDGSTVYRARFLGVDQKTAREVCSHLVKSGQKCLVVSSM